MPVPTILENLMRVMALNDVHQAKTKRELADLYIRPPVERYNILDFRAYNAIIELGYQAARAEIAAWRRTQARTKKEGTRPLDQLGRNLAKLDAWLADAAPAGT
jgi:predicted acylesterase/phospholipase RssA